MDYSIFVYLFGSAFLLAVVFISCYHLISQSANLPETVVIAREISPTDPEEIGKRVTFSQARAMKFRGGEAICSNTCSICLVEFRESDSLRLLHHCQHFFHLACVDPWLLLNPSCPVCRNSRIPPL